MTQQDAVNLLSDIIRGSLRHKWYDRTTKLAKKYKTFITGDNIESYMKKFPRRETQVEFEQRVSLTVNITPTVCGNLIDPQRKVSRSNSIERTFVFTDNDDKKHTELQGIISKFWDKKSVEEYMSNVWIEYNNIDPNAFCVIDWKYNSDGSRIRPYPVEYPSDSVYHYNKKAGELEWICVHREERDKSFDPEMYILYTKMFTIVFTKHKENITWNHDADIVFYQELPVKDINGPVATFRQSKDVYWNVNAPEPHNLGYIPGCFFGYNRDPFTRGETYLSTIDKAFPLLEKIVKSNSELDFTMLLHAFQQKLQYVPPCVHCNGTGRSRDGKVCEVCEGTGENPEQIHKSALDIVTVKRPRDLSREEMIPLKDMIHYVQLDTRLLKFQDEYVDKLTKRCKEAVYNSEVFSRKDVAETATGKNVDLQNVYDALWGLAVSFAHTQTFVVNTIADICDLNKALFYKISFRKDFKMKSLTDLYLDLATVGTSQADEFVKKAIEDDIAQVLYEGDPRQLLKYETTNYFFPFNGKTKKEIEIIITNPQLIREETRILWSNFSYIFDELELEFAEQQTDFYMLNRRAQKQAIDKKVKEILKAIPKPEINVGETVFGDEQPKQQPESETA
jgi:hypothetical protein